MHPARQRPASLLAILVGALAGCPSPGPDSGPPPACQATCATATPGDQLVVEVTADDLQGPVRLELNACQDRALLPDGAPVVVTLLGGFKAILTPVDPDERIIDPRLGLVGIYVNFPIDEGDFVYARVGDYRGGGARRAVVAALRYASGELSDLDGCRLQDRTLVPLSAMPPLLHGQSNGGNLALGMLADDDLSPPPLAGLSLFEVPAAAQFITVEVGSNSAPNDLYEPGSCSWDDEGDEGLTCALDYQRLGWEDDAVSEDGHRGTAYFDMDQDGLYDPQIDNPVWGLRPAIDGIRKIVYSPSLALALAEANLGPATVLGPEESSEFWALRDASRSARRALEHQPELPFLLMGTDQDHTLGLSDHAHITGLAAVLQGSGASWVRVNPDAVYQTLVAGAGVDWPENDANRPTWPGDESISMLPDETTTGVEQRAYVTAGVVELLQRRWLDRWEPDLHQQLLAY